MSLPHLHHLLTVGGEDVSGGGGHVGDDVQLQHAQLADELRGGLLTSNAAAAARQQVGDLAFWCSKHPKQLNDHTSCHVLLGRVVAAAAEAVSLAGGDAASAGGDCAALRVSCQCVEAGGEKVDEHVSTLVGRLGKRRTSIFAVLREKKLNHHHVARAAKAKFLLQ